MTEELTAEEIQARYDAAMDSVTLLNAGQPEDMSDEDWADTVSRNVEHLRIVVERDYMQDQDLAPFNEAIAAHG
jgi:hypothetical protein